MRRGNMEQS